MAAYCTKDLIKLGNEDFDKLENMLTLKVSKYSKGVERGKPGGAVNSMQNASELKKVKDDIIEAYSRGVEIVRQTDSRPMIPLFEAAKIDIPPKFKIDHEKMGYDFYLVETTFNTQFSKDVYPSSAEFRLHLIDDITKPDRRTRAIELFPRMRDANLFNFDLEGSVGVDAGMEISVPEIGNEIIPFANMNADAQAKIKASIVVGPLKFHFRKAMIEVMGEGGQNIFWRYKFDSEVHGLNDYKSILILKVPKEANSVKMLATLSVVPFKHKWTFFKEDLTAISDSFELPIELYKWS